MIEFAKITFYNEKKNVNNFKKLPEDQKWHKNFFLLKLPESANKCKKKC